MRFFVRIYIIGIYNATYVINKLNYASNHYLFIVFMIGIFFYLFVYDPPLRKLLSMTA